MDLAAQGVEAVDPFHKTVAGGISRDASDISWKVTEDPLKAKHDMKFLCVPFSISAPRVSWILKQSRASWQSIRFTTLMSR